MHKAISGNAVHGAVDLQDKILLVTLPLEQDQVGNGRVPEGLALLRERQGGAVWNLCPMLDRDPPVTCCWANSLLAREEELRVPM